MVNTCLHVHVCMYIHILVCTCMYTYTHTYECMYECMCSQPPCTHTNTLAYPHGLTRTHTNLPSFVTWSQSRLSRQFDRPVSGTNRAGIEYGQSACGRRLWKSQSTSLWLEGPHLHFHTLGRAWRLTLGTQRPIPVSAQGWRNRTPNAMNPVFGRSFVWFKY